MLLVGLLALGAMWAQQSTCEDLRRHRTDTSIGNPACGD